MDGHWNTILGPIVSVENGDAFICDSRVARDTSQLRSNLGVCYERI